MIDELMDLIQLKVPKKEIKHRRLWKGSKSKSYSVKEVYETLQQQSNNEESDFFKNLWSIPAPSKVLTFTWKVVLDRVQTKGALKKRRIMMENNDYMSTLCNQTEESIVHLLFESNFLHQVLKSIYKWANLEIAMPIGTKAHFSQHTGICVGRKESLGSLWRKKEEV